MLSATLVQIFSARERRLFRSGRVGKQDDFHKQSACFEWYRLDLIEATLWHTYRHPMSSHVCDRLVASTFWEVHPQ